MVSAQSFSGQGKIESLAPALENGTPMKVVLEIRVRLGVIAMD
jgi:hypothetical protein